MHSPIPYSLHPLFTQPPIDTPYSHLELSTLPLAIYLCSYHMTVFVSASSCVNYIYCTDYISISISHPLHERDSG